MTQAEHNAREQEARHKLGILGRIILALVVFVVTLPISISLETHVIPYLPWLGSGEQNVARAEPDVSDFTYSHIVTVKNNSGAAVTNPILRIPVIPYEAIDVSTWTVTLADSNSHTYNTCIPIRVAEMANETLTNHEVKVGPIDTEWLINNSWASADGNECVFATTNDSTIAASDLMRWYWDGQSDGPYGWDEPDTYFWVEGNLTAWGNDTWYMLIDPDLGSIVPGAGTTKCTSGIFDFHDPMDDGDNWDTDDGSESYAAGICTIRDGTDPEQITSKSTFGEDHGLRARVNVPNADGNDILEGSQFGFSNDGRTLDLAFINLQFANYDEAIECDDAAVTVEDDQYPYVEGSYAVYDIQRRDDHSADNRSVWGQFHCNNVQLTDAPIWTNVPDDALEVLFWSDDENLLIDWVFVYDYVSPEPIVNIPFIHHDPDTVFLAERCEHWPYDIEFTKTGNTSELYNHADRTTLSSEYATEFYVEYIGTINNGASANVTIHYGNAAQSSASAYRDASKVFDGTGAFWDDFEGVILWANTSGTWGLSDQQRAEVFDYHLMNQDDDLSSIWAGSPTWTYDGDEWMLPFVGSWAGTTSNNQGDPQWMIPWENVLYKKIGSQWYRWGYVLTGEYDEFNHASSLGRFAWYGDDSHMGNSSWLYFLLGVTTVEDGDGASFLFYSEDGGKHWKVLNGGAPYVDLTCTDAVDVRGRFASLVYDNGYWFQGYTNAVDSWDPSYLYANDTAFEDMLYDRGTIVPADVWTDGGEIINTGVGEGIEEFYWYQKAGGNWTLQAEVIIDDDLVYSDCDGDDFGITMDSTDWSALANMKDHDDIYQWSAVDRNTPHSVVGGDSPNMVFGGAQSPMERTTQLAFAHSSSFAGDDWTLQNIDKERCQAADAAAWQTSTVTGGNYSAGEIIAECTVHTTGGDGYAGIVWRYEDDDNFCAWVVNSINDTMSYGIQSGGVWSGLTSYDPGEEIWLGENYRLAVEFDGATTTLKYSKIGWEWTTAYSDIDLSDGNVANYGSAGTITYGTYGLFDDFRISPNALGDLEITDQGMLTVTTEAATGVGTTSATLVGNITAGTAAAIGFAWGTASCGDPGDTAPGDSSYNLDSRTNVDECATGQYTHGATGLPQGSTIYYRFAAQSEAFPGTWYWGDEESFSTAGTPTCVTDTATNVDETSATLRGNITADETVAEMQALGYTVVSTGPSNYGVGDYSDAISGLNEGTCYYARFGANNTVGFGWGSEVTLVTLPRPPNTCTVSSYDEDSISLTWNAGNGSGDTVIRYGTSCPANYTDGSSGYVGNGTSCTISGLSEGTQYCFREWSNTTSCSETVWSSTYCEITQYTLPGNITNLDADNPSATTIDLEWTVGSGANSTVVRGKQGSYPTDRTDGVEVYNSTGNSTTHTGLGCGESWYYRAWSYDAESGYYSAGYSEDANATSACNAPAVVTTSATSVNVTSATLNGNITDTGNSDVTNYAFVWGNSSQAAPVGAPPGNYDDSWTSDAGNYTVGDYNHGAPGLNEGDCYHFRIGANNSGGWTWGDELTFVTLPYPPHTCSATLADLTDTFMPFTWVKGSGANETVWRYDTVANGCPANVTDGLDAGTYSGTSGNISGLAPSTEYCVWGQCNTTACNETVWSDGHCDFNQYTRPGNCTNFDADNPSDTTLDIEWTVGLGSDYTMVRYRTDTYPTDEADGTQAYYDTGNSTTLTLDCNTTYYFRAWAYYTVSGLYAAGYCQDGNATLTCQNCTVVTNPATDVEETSATLNGNLTDVGSGNATDWGFVWSTSSHGAPGNVAPGASGYEQSSIASGNHGVGTFSGATGDVLSEGDCYYFRAWANNTGGYSYGEERQLFTKPDEPSGCSATDHTYDSVTLSWTNGDGYGNVTVRYDTTLNGCPADETDGSLGYWGTAATTTVSGLDPNTEYCFRIWSHADGCNSTSWYSDLYCEVTEYTSPGNVTNCDAHGPTYTTIDLDWTVGNNSDMTLVLGRNDGSYPTGPTDGAATTVYYGAGNTTTHTDLTCGDTWHYGFYGYAVNSGYYSDDPCQDTETVVACIAPTVLNVSGNYTSCSTASIVGNVTGLGGTNVVRRGVTYDTICRADPGNGTAPAASAWTWNEMATGDWGVGTYTTSLTGLTESTTYYWMAVVYNGFYWDYSGVCGNFTTPACPECVEPGNLTATAINDTKIELEWSGDTINNSIIRMGLDEAPSGPTQGNPVFDDVGNSTAYYYDMDCCFDGDIYFSLWTDCGNGTYKGPSTASVTGGAGVTAIGIGLNSLGMILLAVLLTVAMFHTRNKLLGFPCLIFWAILGGYFYQQSEATWDINYLLFFASMGMAIFTGYAAYALRKSDLSGPNADEGAFIDEGGGSGGKRYVEDKESDEYIDEGESKPSARTRDLRARAARRRSGNVSRKPSWDEFK